MSQFIMTGIIILSVPDDVMQSYARPLPAVNSCSTSWADVTFHCHPQSHSHVIPRSASASPQVHKPQQEVVRTCVQGVGAFYFLHTHARTHKRTHKHTHTPDSAACHVHLLAVTSLCARARVPHVSFLRSRCCARCVVFIGRLG